MQHKLTAFPIGNADTTRIDLANGKKLLFDFADMRHGNTDEADKRIDLPTTLREDLKAANRTYFDVVAFTHLDNDHLKGSSSFFHLDHAQKYQGADRITIREMWVPAAALLEDECDDEARIIQAEARYRLRQNKGIRVFSFPGKLEDWLRKQSINPADRAHLITDAGKLIPGFSLSTDGVEFFVHSPLASRSQEGELIERNSDALTVQATFEVNGRKSRVHLFSDVPWEVLKYILRVTENRAKKDDSRYDRLRWDAVHIAHHGSYKSLALEKGDDITDPEPEIIRLFEEYGEHLGVLICPSRLVPTDDEDVQPPHRQAVAYYKSVAKLKSGKFIITMGHPTASAPKPVVLQIDRFGITVVQQSNVGSAAVIGSQIPPRAGSSGTSLPDKTDRYVL